MHRSPTRRSTTRPTAIPSAAGRQDDRGHRLRQPGARPRPEPPRLRQPRSSSARGRTRARWTRADGRRPARSRRSPRRPPRRDIVMILVPDHVQAGRLPRRDRAQPPARLDAACSPTASTSTSAAIEPATDVDVAMIAPKGPGHLVRRQYAAGIGVPGLDRGAPGRDRQRAALALAYGHGIGCARGGLIETTFAEETETDLFGEQAVLCGGTTQLVQVGFETLVEAGYQPEIAYFECLHELKLIVDLMCEGGLAGMRYSISDTAEYGDLTRGPMVIDDHVRENMRKILSDIQDGTFAREMMAEEASGRPHFTALRAAAADHHIEPVGAACGHDAVDPRGDQGEGGGLDVGTQGSPTAPSLRAGEALAALRRRARSSPEAPTVGCISEAHCSGTSVGRHGRPLGSPAWNDVTPNRRVRLARRRSEPAAWPTSPHPRAVRRPPRLPRGGRGGRAGGGRAPGSPRTAAPTCASSRSSRSTRRAAWTSTRRCCSSGRPAGTASATRSPTWPTSSTGEGHRGGGVAARRHRLHARRPLPALPARPRGGCREPAPRRGPARDRLHDRARRGRTGRRRRRSGARSSEAASSSTTPISTASARRSSARSPSAASRLRVARGAVALNAPEQRVVPDSGSPCGYRLEWESRMASEDWNAEISLLAGTVAAAVMLRRRVGLLRTMGGADPYRVECAQARRRRARRALAGRAAYEDFARDLRPTDAPQAALLEQARGVMGHAGYVAFSGEVPAAARARRPRDAVRAYNRTAAAAGRPLRARPARSSSRPAGRPRPGGGRDARAAPGHDGGGRVPRRAGRAGDHRRSRGHGSWSTGWARSSTRPSSSTTPAGRGCRSPSRPSGRGSTATAGSSRGRRSPCRLVGADPVGRSLRFAPA